MTLRAILSLLLLAACHSTDETGDTQQQVPDSGPQDTSSTDSGDPDTGAANAVWSPTPGTTWDLRFASTPSLSELSDAQMIDLDLFDTDQALMAQIKQAGHTLICYFSAGSIEEWREDVGDFPAAARGNPLDGWEGEWWVDHRLPEVRQIMEARLDLAATKGCDGVDPDNVDGYANDNGLGLTAADQLDYNRFLAEAAHVRGLSVGLKNDLGQIHELTGDFDWAINEQCALYDECDLLSAFTGSDKAVFHVEYVEDWSQAEAKAAEFCGVGPDLSTIIKLMDLGAEMLACP